MRDGAGDDEIAAALGGIWRERADRYSELRSSATPRPPEGRDVLHRRLRS